MNGQPGSGPVKCVRIKRNGERCGNWPMRGGTLCHKHGGAAPQIRAAAQRRLQATEAREAVRQLGVDQGIGKIDPRDALELELWRSHVQVLMYDALVDDLPLGEGGIYGRTYHATGRPTGEGKPHVLVELRDRERRHLADVALAAAKAGVEERRVALAEQEATLVANVFAAVFEELGLEGERRQHASAVAARHLRALESSEDGGDGDGR